MRIVDRATFIAMPSGTVFAKYEPHSLGEVAIKCDTCAGVDFVIQELAPWMDGAHDSAEYFDGLERARAGEEVGLDYDSASRDGLFDQDQLFAVWSANDTRQLIARLEAALAESESADTKKRFFVIAG